MNAKTIFIILLTALVTIILMKNADEVEFWIFGTYMVPKLAVLGTMFLIGVVVGLMIGRGKKKQLASDNDVPAGTWEKEDQNSTKVSEDATPRDQPLSDEDSDYIR